MLIKAAIILKVSLITLFGGVSLNNIEIVPLSASSNIVAQYCTITVSDVSQTFKVGDGDKLWVVNTHHHFGAHGGGYIKYDDSYEIKSQSTCENIDSFEYYKDPFFEWFKTGYDYKAIAYSTNNSKPSVAKHNFDKENDDLKYDWILTKHGKISGKKDGEESVSGKWTTLSDNASPKINITDSSYTSSKDSAGEYHSVTWNMSASKPSSASLLADFTCTDPDHQDSNHDDSTTKDLKDFDKINLNSVKTWTAYFECEDSYGNEEQRRIRVNIRDNSNPNVSLTGEEIILPVGTYEHSKFNNEYWNKVIKASSTGGISSIVNNASSKVDLNKIGAYTVTYTITNKSGVKSTFDYEVRIIDEIAPTLTVPSETYLVEAGDEEKDYYEDIVVTDNYYSADEIDIKIIKDEELNLTKVGFYTHQVIATDPSGHSKNGEIHVAVVDTNAPEINLKENQVQLSLGDSEFDFESLIVDINDIADGEISLELDMGNFEFGEAGDYSISVIAIDESQNQTIEHIYINVANVKGDLRGEYEIRIEFGGEEYSEFGIYIEHGSRGDISNEVIIYNTYEEEYKGLGEYLVFYGVKEGNTFINLGSRLVILEDTTPPTFEEIDDEYRVNNSMEWDLLSQVLVSDNHTSEESIIVHIEGEYNLLFNGTYEVKVHATDSEGNVASHEVIIFVEQSQTYAIWAGVAGVSSLGVAVVLLLSRGKKRV